MQYRKVVKGMKVKCRKRACPQNIRFEGVGTVEVVGPTYLGVLTPNGDYIFYRPRELEAAGEEGDAK